LADNSIGELEGWLLLRELEELFECKGCRGDCHGTFTYQRVM
jgi:hypothetical protein